MAYLATTGTITKDEKGTQGGDRLFQSFEEEREGIFERSIRDSFLFLY
jgi:hypothetical protein